MDSEKTPYRLNKEFNPKFPEDYLYKQTPEEGTRIYSKMIVTRMISPNNNIYRYLH